MVNALLLASSALVSSASAFVAPQGRDLFGSVCNAKPRMSASEPMSKALPWMKQPKGLDNSLVGDYGFDPLGLATRDLNLGSVEKGRSLAYVLRDYREAEIRHGRLAMLAALAWPVQELVHPVISRALRDPILTPETAGRSPSVLNGGLEQGPIPFFIAAVALAIAAVDLKSLKLREEQGDAYIPGDFGFDPLNLMSPKLSDEKKRDIMTKELNNGRLAMMAVLIYVIQEKVTGLPITEVSKALFQPIIFNANFQTFLDNAFQFGSFDGVF